MTHLEIIETDGVRFKLVNKKTKQEQSLLLEFYEMDLPKVGDVLVLADKLLDRRSRDFVQPYAFTPTTEEEVKARNIDREDLAGLNTGNKNIILKRLYG